MIESLIFMIFYAYQLLLMNMDNSDTSNPSSENT
jgi:hypothetical protein